MAFDYSLLLLDQELLQLVRRPQQEGRRLAVPRDELSDRRHLARAQLVVQQRLLLHAQVCWTYNTLS